MGGKEGWTSAVDRRNLAWRKTGRACDLSGGLCDLGEEERLGWRRDGLQALEAFREDEGQGLEQEGRQLVLLGRRGQELLVGELAGDGPDGP